MVVSFFLYFTPTWGKGPIWRAYFSDGVGSTTNYDIQQHYNNYTPWKINGWNLQNQPIWKGKWSIHQTSMRKCSMLIFREEIMFLFYWCLFEISCSQDFRIIKTRNHVWLVFIVWLIVCLNYNFLCLNKRIPNKTNPKWLTNRYESYIWMFPKIVGFSPKSSILIGFSIINIHFGVPLFLETPISLFFGGSTFGRFRPAMKQCSRGCNSVGHAMLQWSSQKRWGLNRKMMSNDLIH